MTCSRYPARADGSSRGAGGLRRPGGAQELRTRRVADPALVPGAAPPAPAAQQLPCVGVVERPQDVRRPADIQAGTKRALRGDALDDRPLVGVVLGVDAFPQLADVGVERRGRADDLGERADLVLAPAGVARVET